MATGRIYVVINGDERRMVDATSASAAIRHCVEPRYIARVATAREVAELAKYGIAVETAGEHPQPLAPTTGTDNTTTTGQAATN